MNQTTFTSLLDAAAPPRDFTFKSGIWLTHDLDHQGLTLGVAPALAGCEHPDPRKRILAARDFSGKLAVIASWDRVTARPPTNRITLDFGPIGRRQHAKLAILGFRGPKGRQVIRAVVTSANLTSGGLGRNRELLVVEESDGTGALAKELTAALRRYAALPELMTRTKSRILSRLGELGTKPSLASASVMHSFGPDQGVLEQLKQIPSAAGATAITLIDPGFARGNFQKLAKALHEAFPDVATIRMVGQENERGELQFPPELRAAIEQRFGVTPSIDAVTGDRTLHAKAIAWTGPEGDATMIGSANLTSSGLLGGRNLELCVVVDGVEVTKVRTRPCPVGTTLVPRVDDQEQALPVMVGVGSITGIGPHRTLRCIIEIEAHGVMPTTTWKIEDAQAITGPLRMTTEGPTRPLLCWGLEVMIDQDNWHVWVHSGAKSALVPLDLTGSKWPDADARVDVEDPPPSALVRLFTSIHNDARKSGAAQERVQGRASDILSKPDKSLVHRIAWLLRREDGLVDLDGLRQFLDSPETRQWLTAGERWALGLLMEEPSIAGDPRDKRITEALKALL